MTPSSKSSKDQSAILRQRIEELKNSETHYRDILDSVPVGVYESNLSGKLLQVNRQIVKMLGYPCEQELLDTNLKDIYYNYDSMITQVMLALQRSQHLENIDLRIHRFDGTLIWASVNLAMVHDENGRFRIRGIVSDVTTRKKSERALQESQEQYQSVVMALVEGVLIGDKNGVVVACNPRAEEILGLTTNEIIGKPPLNNMIALRQDDTIFPNEEYPSTLALNTGQPCVNCRMQIQRPDGASVWIAINSTPLSYPGEETPYGVVSSFQDITQEVLTQDQLERQMQTLRVINAIAGAATQSQDESDFLRDVTEWVKGIFQRTNLDLLILNQSKGLLEDSDQHYQIELGTKLCAIVAIDGLLRNVQTSKNEIESYKPLHENSRSVLCAPIKVDGKILGVMNLESQRRRAFGKDMEEMLRALALQIGRALKKVRSMVEERQRLEQLQTLVNISRAMRRAQSTNEILSILVDRTMNILQADSLCLLLEDDNLLKVEWYHNLSPTLFGQSIAPNYDDPYWQVIQNRQMSYLPTEHMPTEENLNPVLKEVIGHSYWSVLMPLKATHTMLGLMHIAFNDHRKQLTRSEREILTTIAEIAGISLHRAQITETLEQRVIERTRSLEALYNIRKVTGSLHEVPELLTLALQEVLTAMQTDAGAIYMVEDTENNRQKLQLSVSAGVEKGVVQSLHSLEYESQIFWEDWMLHDPRIMQIPDLMQRYQVPEEVVKSNLRHFVALPMRFKNELIGVLAVFSHKADSFAQEDLNLLETIADQIADGLETSRLRKKAQEGAVLQERQRLARELHDSVTQALYSLNLMVNAARRFAEKGNLDRATYYLDQLPDISQQALKEMRLLIYDLRPYALEEEGLFMALTQRLETVERRAGVDAKLECEPTIKLPPDTEEGLYRITIEALNNILKHATATKALVRLKKEGDQIFLDVEDNGKGFDPSGGITAEGIGMKSMRERTEQLGGTFEIFSKQDNGTIVRAIIPIRF